MKLLVGLMSLALSFASLASSGETKTFVYDGSQNSVELLLKGEKTHTEYRYENRRTTCYRTEVVGYRTTCTGGTYPGPRPGPRPTPGRTCYRQPIYRQVAYPCTQTVQIPYEVKDYDVDARVLIDVTKLSDVATTGETFTVTLQGDALSLAASGSKAFLINLKKQDLRATVNGSVKFIDALYAVELMEAAPVLKALKLTNISMDKSVLNFNLGPIASRANIGFSLYAVKNRRLASDVVVFNRDLVDSEIDLAANAAGTDAGINVENLGITLDDAKFTFTAKAFFKTTGTLLNKAQFGNALEASKTLIWNNRNK